MRGVAFVIALGALTPACTGGIHARGDRQVLLGLNYGAPSTHLDEFAPSGAKGTARNIGFTASYYRYVRSRLALGAGATPVRWYDQGGGDAYATEVFAGLRYFPWEFEVRESPFGLFLDLAVGVSYSDPSVPPTGTHFNYIYDIGLGMEWRATEKTSWIFAYHIRHLSNAKGSNSTVNPSQNDHNFGVAFAFNW